MAAEAVLLVNRFAFVRERLIDMVGIMRRLSYLQILSHAQARALSRVGG